MRDAHGDAPELRPGRVEDHADFVRLFGELGVEESPPPLDVWVSDLVKRAFFLEGPGGAAGTTCRRWRCTARWG